MNNSTLFNRCHVNTNIENDVFVGILKKDDYYEVDFPLGYHLSDDEKNLRKDILSLMSILAKYSDKRESKLYDGQENDTIEFPVQAYLYIIKISLNMGITKNVKQIIKLQKEAK